MRRTGRVHDVNEDLRGADLIVDAALGAVQLTLEHVGYFDDLGGQARLRNIDTDATEAVTYLRLDDDAGILYLGAGTLAAWPAATTRVDVLPLENPRTAQVLLDDAENEQDVIDATVPAALYDRLPLGPRDLEEDREAVLVSTEGLWLHEVADILGQAPEITGEFTDPTTLPPPSPSDGLAPSASPAVVVTQGIGTLFLRWAAIVNADPVTYDVHVALTPGFTPTPATKAFETDATSGTLKSDAAGLPLVVGTDYRIRLVARDDDGQAAAGTEANGTPRRADVDDIAAGSVTTDKLAANAVTADKLEAVLAVVGEIVTALTGSRVRIFPGGLENYGPDNSVRVKLPTDPSESALFNGEVIAAALEVIGAATLRGLSEIATGGSLSLAASASNPTTKPTVSIVHEALVTTDVDAQRAGLFYDAAGGAGGATPSYLTVAKNGSTYTVREIVAATGATSRTITLPAGVWDSGVARMGSWIYVLSGGNGADWKVRRYLQSTLTFVDEINLTAIGGPTPSQPAHMTADGTNVVTVGHNTVGGASRLKLWKWTSALALSSTTLLDSSYTSDAFSSELTALLRTAADGTDSWWVGHRNTGANPDVIEITAFRVSDSLRRANVEFTDAAAQASVGLAHDGTRFRSLAGVWPAGHGSQITRHTDWTWTTESPLYWIGYTWVDDAGTVHESLVSPRQSITHRRRAALRVTTPAIPVGGVEDPNKARVYMSRGAVEPQAGGRFLGIPQVTDALTVRDLSTFVTSGTQNPATNDFPGGTPGKITSAIGGLEIHGDGKLLAPSSPHASLPAGTTHDRRVLWDDEAHTLLVNNGRFWVPAGSLPFGRWAKVETDFLEDFGQSPLGFTGGDGATAQASTASHPGVMRLSVSAVGANCRWFTFAESVRTGDGGTWYGALIRVAGLSSSTERYRMVVGLYDNALESSIANGVYFLYQDNVNGGAWQGRARAATVLTTHALSATVVAASTWYLLEIWLTADGTGANFYINGSLVGTIGGMPAAGSLLEARGGIEKVVGTGARVLDLDALYLLRELPAARW